MPAETITTATIVDAIARVCARAIGPDAHVFAAGVTTDVTTAEPLVVPVADDFSEAGMPAVTVALGPWSPALQPGNERLTLTLLGAIWANRLPLAENTQLLYAARDSLADAFIEHTKAFLHEARVKSAVLMGGPGIRPRSVPRGLSATEVGERIFLTLPFTVEVKCNRTVVPQPA
jgi:hypothetical protein